MEIVYQRQCIFCSFNKTKSPCQVVPLPVLCHCSKVYEFWFGRFWKKLKNSQTEREVRYNLLLEIFVIVTIKMSVRFNPVSPVVFSCKDILKQIQKPPIKAIWYHIHTMQVSVQHTVGHHGGVLKLSNLRCLYFGVKYIYVRECVFSHLVYKLVEQVAQPSQCLIYIKEGTNV